MQQRNQIAGEFDSVELVLQVLNLVAFCLTVLGLWMFADCVMKEPDRSERNVWAVLLVLVPPLFGPIYFVQRYKLRKRTT